MSFENWHKEFDKIWPEHSKVSKIFILMGSFWAKYIMFELKKYRGIIFHETEEEYKIWRGIDLPFQNWHRIFYKFWPEHSKVSKIFIWMSSFWEKYILFELKRYRGVIFYETEDRYEIFRGIDSPFQNWQKEFDKIWPQLSQVSKIFILMGSFWEKYILFELKKVQRNNLSWHWRVIHNLKKNDLLFGNWLNWRILEIFTRKVESVKIGTFIRSFCPKQKMYEL